MKERRIQVHDLMQSGYSYVLTEPAGKNFHPDFRPALAPKDMLELGVFGGKYMTDCTDEFPPDWFDIARLCPDRLLVQHAFCKFGLNDFAICGRPKR